MNQNSTLWVEKYRPVRLDDCILPSRILKPLKEIVSSKDCGNLLFSGPAGCGKTTAAYAICRELDCDFIKINCSEDSGIDTLRGQIRGYATSVSLSGNGKVVILDEFDYANPNSFQPALRSAMEEFSSNCRFIITCNFRNRIIDPIHSRCTCVDFTFDQKEKDRMTLGFYERACFILKEEGVSFEEKIVAKVIKRYAPDFRRCINELQGYARGGSIDVGILAANSDLKIEELAGQMKGKEFAKVRKWVAENLNNDMTVVFAKLFRGLEGVLQLHSIPDSIVILADYQYKAAFVADHEINLTACLVEIMMRCEFK